MQKTLIIFALLALATSALNHKLQNVDTKLVLAEMEKDQFGNAMISALALNVAVESPLEDIVLLVQEILDQINADQAANDEKNRTDQAVCDEVLATLNNEIRQHKDAIATLTSSIADNEDLLSQAKIDLQQAQHDYEETVTAIETGTAQRAAEHAAWADEDYQNSVEVATLEEGVKLITHMVHGVAFSQIKVRYDKVLLKLRDNESQHASLFKPLITSLTQIASKLNYENVMKILELLNNIRASIVQEQVAAKSAEERAQADWEALLATLTEQKNSLGDKINRLTALIQSTEELLVRLRESLEFHQTELGEDQAALAAQTTWCDEQSATYALETTERSRELEILTKLSEHVQERFQAVNEYVSSRDAQF